MEKRSGVVLLVVFGGLLAVLLVFFGLAFFAMGGGRDVSRHYRSGNVGVLEIRDAIMDSDPVVEDIRHFAESDTIRAVVVRIDSPGGGAAASQEIYAELRRLGETKQVVASMASVAASGGYYVALPAHRILANPGTLTGSIGVISQFPNLQQLSEKVGIEMNTVTSGAAKDAGNPFRSFDAADRALFQGLVDSIYEQFVAAVVESRGLPDETVRRLADGRVYTGEQAKDAGLIDELGTFRDAVDLAASLAGIEGEPELVYPPKPKTPFWTVFFRSAAQEAVRATADELRHQIRAEGQGAVPMYLLPMQP